MNSVKNPMHLWFIYLFDQRKDKNGYVKCFECGKKMHESAYKELSICYSHLLEKKKYPEFAGNEENVVICCPDCHNLYSMSPRKAINQYNLKLKLIEKYDKGI
jgi:hypothetical protein